MKHLKWKCYVAFLSLTMIMLFSMGAEAQSQRETFDLKGAVRDDVGEVLPGVTVSNLLNKNVAITDNEGRFSIPVAMGDTVLFSHLGFTAQAIVIRDKSDISVNLSRSTGHDLDEVVVIGYGTVRRSDLTGSIGEVDMGDLQHAPVASVGEALAGRLAGVQVSGNDGQPGQEPNIVIRGAGSLTQSTGPLYVIDGFPVEDFNLGSLSPSDIESITVLKDASATAIYGARAANGVIVIETKMGKSGKTEITFNTSAGRQEPQKVMDVMDPYEFVRYQQEFNPILADTTYLDGGRTLESYRNERGIDWQSEMFSRTPIYINDLSIRGGSAQTQFSLSGSAYNQTGVILSTGHERYQGRVAVNHSINERLRTGIVVNYSSTETTGQTVATGIGINSEFTTNLMFRTWGYRPLSGRPGVDLVEELVDPDNNGTNDIRINPVISSKNDYTKNYGSDLLANMFVTFQIAKGLELKSILSANNYERKRELFFNSLTPQGSPLNFTNFRGVHGSLSINRLNVLSNENMITYQTKINNVHDFTLVGGFSTQARNTQGHGFSSQNIENEKLGIAGLDQGEAYNPVSTTSNSTLVSTFGRLSYSYGSRYFFTGTLRADGSSKFAPENRWGVFPSASFAWNLHREKFFTVVKPIVSYAKIRLSYGVIGNNRVSDFPYLQSVNSSLALAYSFNNSTPLRGAAPNALGNRDLRWESTAQANAGLDVNFFKNRLRLVADVYEKMTTDLLLNAELPRSTGYLRSFKNIGRLQNRGLELTLTSTNVDKRNFTWETSFNISFNKNKILELTQGQETWYSNIAFHNNYAARPLYLAEIGQPAGMFYGFVFDGVYQYEDFDNPSEGVYELKEGIPTYGNQVQPGSIKYRDLDGNYTITDADQKVIGRGQPIHIGGFSNALRYKDFDLNVFLQWSYGNDLYNANRLIFEGNAISVSGLNQFASYADRWTPENPSNTLFRTRGGGPSGHHSSRVVEDGSYLRVKTISLGYHLPQRIAKRFYATSLRINFSAQNLLTFTNYSGVDPEVSVRNSVLTPGFDYSAYPQPRTMVLGINAGF